MAVKTFNTRIKLKYDGHDNWQPSSGDGLVLLQGEFGYDATKKNFFIGDGTTSSKNLKYVIGDSIMADYVAAPQDVTLTESVANTDSLNIALAKLQTQVSNANARTIGDGALKLSGYGAINEGQIPTVTATDIFSANDTEDSTIALGEGFVLDTTNKTIGIRTNQAVTATNNIATMSDIASLSGAMHYKGGITEYPTPTAETKAGDTYVVTTAFTNDNVSYEVGDMFVASSDGASATYTVVQSNLTLGINQGQVAPNSSALNEGKIVVASSNGIETSSYSVTDIASEAVSVTSSESTVTVSDTLTVGGTAQTAQSFTITGSAPISVSSTGNNITISSSALTEVKTLKTSSNAQSVVPTGESLSGSGDVTLHQIAKTGNTNDLIQGLTLLFDCGSATTTVETPSAE